MDRTVPRILDEARTIHMVPCDPEREITAARRRYLEDHDDIARFEADLDRALFGTPIPETEHAVAALLMAGYTLFTP